MKIKKVILLVVLILIFVIIGIGVAFLNTNSEEIKKVDTDMEINNSTTTVISEDLFMSQLNDIYTYYNEYDGKTIIFEGFTYTETFEEENVFVVGREYYCCGDDSYVVGFECRFPEGMEKQEFENDTWLKVTGTIEIINEHEGLYYPVVIIESLEEIPEGIKTVNF